MRPESAPKLLTDLDQKLELLVSTGIDAVELIHFDDERATETAEDFIVSVLVAELGVSTVVVGRNFHFGKARSGNVALLEEMGPELGYRVVPFDLVMDEPSTAGGAAEVISSTRVRQLISAGDLVAATRLLERPHEVRGIAADALSGNDMTIRVPDGILLPPPGSYAGHLAALEYPGKWQDCEARIENDGGGATVVVVAGDDVARHAGEAVRLTFDRAV